MGSICNILTIKGSPAHLRGRILSIQQVMYGLGSFLGPMTFALFYNGGFPWWSAITLLSFVNFVLAVIIFRVVPDEAVSESETSNSEKKLQLKVLVPIVLFAIYVGGEVLTSMWMTTYYTKVLNYQAAEASQLASFFFIAISASRFLSFLTSSNTMGTPCDAVLPSFRNRFYSASNQRLSLSCFHCRSYGTILSALHGSSLSHFSQQWKALTIWIFAAIQTCLA